jgi:hypothetical protein
VACGGGTDLGRPKEMSPVIGEKPTDSSRNKNSLLLSVLNMQVSTVVKEIFTNSN